MLIVSICHNDLKVCTQLEQIISTYSQVQTEIYFSEKTMCHALKNKQYDLFFLQVDCNSINGLKIAKTIRSDYKNAAAKIVFISENDKYAMKLFQFQPLNFLLTPFKNNEIIDCINFIIGNDMKNNYFEFSIRKCYYKIKYDEILYFESHNKKISVVTQQKTFEYYDAIKNILKIMPRHQFINIHKSYLVNQTYIRELHYDHVVLVNNTILPISQRLRPYIKHNVIKK